MSSADSRSVDAAYFFFVDVVGLSDPTMPVIAQVRKLEFLTTSIADCKAFRITPKNDRIVIPTGDGMAIGFLRGPQLPLELAIELHQKIASFNKGKVPSEGIGIRIGIHYGPFFTTKDLNNNPNVWGTGIILAKRVMDLGEAGHILMSKRVADDLMDISDEYKMYLHRIGEHEVKHGVRVKLYSAYNASGSKRFGNKNPSGRWKREIVSRLYPYIGVNLSIKDPTTMLVHHKRVCEIQNISDVPLFAVNHQIATDVGKTFEELGIKIHDGNGKELEISNIKVDNPEQKEFDTAFSPPIAAGERRGYILEYDVEEPNRYFENIFFTDCDKFEVNIDYPESREFRTPISYEGNMDDDKKEKTKEQPALLQTSKGRKLAHWTRTDVHQGQSFRFEW